ncbi:phosphocarrier protein HPr [Candidatus Pacearchaeota archaeon]|nr:MAG: phosphocarrier protein HPr [Candidatus Pacearchaeota archaeon]
MGSLKIKIDPLKSVIKRKVVLKNKLGIHARPATLFANTANKYKCIITVEKNGYEVDGKNILELLTLVAPGGTEIIIKADGEDEKEAIEELVKLVEDGFGEE